MKFEEGWTLPAAAESAELEEDTMELGEDSSHNRYSKYGTTEPYSHTGAAAMCSEGGGFLTVVSGTACVCPPGCLTVRLSVPLSPALLLSLTVPWH